MVGVVSGSLYRQTHSLKSSGLVLGRRPLGAILHSSNEPGELSQWLCHDDSIINIVLDIIIIIIIKSPKIRLYNGEKSGKVIRNLYPGPEHHQKLASFSDW